MRRDARWGTWANLAACWLVLALCGLLCVAVATGWIKL